MMLQPDRPFVAAYDSGPARVLVPTGDFDISCRDLLRDPLLAATAHAHGVVLDLSGTTFVDSTILGVLVEGVRRASATGDWLRIVAPRPNIRRVLRLMALDTIIGLYDTVDEAVRDGSPLVSGAATRMSHD